MCDEWMPVIRLAMSIDDYHRVPRHAAYKYEYYNGTTVISPRPQFMHAALDLAAFRVVPADLPPEDDYVIGPAEPGEALANVFAGAFGHTQPFASLLDNERDLAAAESLRRTFAGEEGPYVSEASFIARTRSEEQVVGAILTTLLPDADPTRRFDYYWHEPAPAGLWEAGRGRPHITWIFTHFWHKGEGIGTRLLAAAVERLKARGDRQLFTTFMAGNDSSMLWHWRNGFTLLPSEMSKRSFRARVKP